MLRAEPKQRSMYSFLYKHKVSVDLFSYNGTVYIPLRTAGEWMGCTVAWDQETQVATLTTGGTPCVRDMTQEESSYSETALTQYQLDKANGMDVQLRTDIKVVVDGKMQQFQNAGGLAVYPVVFRDVIYLPVRSIGALCGKEVGWIPGDPYPLSIDSLILIFDPLTPSQLAEIQSYYSACKEQYGIIAEASNTLTSTAGLSKEDALSQLNTIKGYLGQLRTMSKPSAPIFDKWYLSVSQYVPDDMEYSRVDTYIGYMDGTIFTGKKADWDTYRIDFKGLMDEDLLSFKRSLDRMSTIVEVLSRQS